ncbi:PLP-dependent aminotransferase family protein [Oligella ureolytica]
MDNKYRQSKIMNQRQPIARKHKKQNSMWIRPLESDGGARYQQIAQQVINAVNDGVLTPGDRLPPQRELANTMGVDLTTVTRAYKELRLAGLLEAHGAGGSYIASYLGDEEQIVDLSMNIPPLLGVDGFARRMGPSLSYMRDHADDGSLMSYHVGAGSSFDREAAASWLEAIFGVVNPARLLISAGAQPAISAIILAYSRPGEGIAAEKLTYPGFLAACRVLQREVLAVESDEEGMIPDDLERVCKINKPKIIYLVPTISNPTATTMSLARRQAIYDIAVRYDIAIIEDDPYWLLAGDAPPPIATLAQDSRKAPVFYISTLSKCLAPGLRTAYILLPTLESMEPIQEALRAIMLMPNQSTVSMATHLIRNG